MLENLKKDVCEIAKRAQRDGLCKHKSGNFSARDVKSGYIVITPTSVDRELLTPRDMIVMDLEANVIENLSGLKPTSESLMHITIYKTRKDANAIAHTHSMYATTFALSNMGLTKGRVPVAPYGRPGTMELANSVVDACMEAESFLMESHGAVAFDSQDIYEAFLKAAYIEELAQLYYNAVTVLQGKEPKSFAQEELQKWEYPKEIKFPKQ